VILRGALKTWHSGSYTADVQLDGSLITYLEGIPVSRALSGGDMVAGRMVAVWLAAENSPLDAVVIAVWT
jgi:hypothetical protein